MIVAGGRGSRLGAPVPKQYADVAGQPLIRRAVRAFLDHPAVGTARVVVGAGQEALCAEALAGLPLPAPVIGGAERQDSVRAGLEALAGDDPPPDTVLIHDAARPFVPAALIDRVLAAATRHKAAIPALAVADSLKRADAHGAVVEAVPREGLWRAQTPQGFDFRAILAAHRAARGRAFSDDAAVAAESGLAAQLVDGAEETAKVTTQADLEWARRHAAGAGETRVGQGVDVHRLGPGDGVTLCGVAIPAPLGLIGHSDADVAWHALTDALMGAVGAGDIGAHFPPSDPRWKGASSDRFLAEAAALVRAAGGAIAHVDVTVVCEVPKIGPHRAAMRARTAEVLEIEAARVSIKATTSEGLGFAGRGEGIAAQAVATVRL